jgi:hypothetical protein
MARNAVPPIVTAEPGLTHYLEEIRRFPMLQRQEEYLLAKRWREHGDRDAAHKLVTSHLRLVTKIARDYRGYDLGGDLRRSRAFAHPLQRSRGRPDSAGNVKKTDLLRMRVVERTNCLGGRLQQDRTALFRKIRLSFRR